MLAYLHHFDDFVLNVNFLPCCSLFFSFSGRLFHFGVKYPVISDFICISCVPFPFVFCFNYSAEQF